MENGFLYIFKNLKLEERVYVCVTNKVFYGQFSNGYQEKVSIYCPDFDTWGNGRTVLKEKKKKSLFKSYHQENKWCGQYLR